MEVLLTGATGAIGKEVLVQCLNHPSIATVVAFSRRELPEEVSGNGKLKVIVRKDFEQWCDATTLEDLKDADAMIWTMGTYHGDPVIDLEFPINFQSSLLNAMSKRSRISSRFRYVHLSGCTNVQDQNKPLWFLKQVRRIKGKAEAECIDFAREHSDAWQTYIVRPGGVLPKEHSIGTSILKAILGKKWCIRLNELGAAMVDLAINGREERTIIESPQLVDVGRELLKRGS